MSGLITKIIGFSWRKFSRYLAPFWFKSKGITITGSSNIILYGLPIIQRVNGASIAIGSRVVLCSRSEYTALGIARPIIIRAMSAGAQVSIGSDVGLSGTTICADKKITIGDNCLIGADVMICDTDFHPINPIGRRYGSEGIYSAEILIGNNVFIGARTIILKGISVGDNSIIGAGSVVSSSIPSNCIAAGNPCRIIRQLQLPI